MNLSCSSLDTTNYTAFANWVPILQTTSTSTGIGFAGFPDGYTLVSILALDTSGVPLFQSFQLLFGSAKLPVKVIGSDGEPVAGASFYANATQYKSIGEAGITDSQGMFTFINVPAITIGLIARTSNNQIAVNGIAGDSGDTLTLQLLPLEKPNNNTNFNEANGTFGWTGGTIENVPTARRSEVPNLWKSETSLVISTNGMADLQYASASFATDPSTTSVYLRYRFQTEEVPGGYFGSQFNDYFSVTIRADTGESATVAHSMNELGLGAFNANGATDWYTLSLEAAGASFVEFNVAVTNVADTYYDSKVVIQQAGQDKCDKCASCEDCPNNPMCQPLCKDPPQDSCSFYQSCSEAVLECDFSGYALVYGERVCDTYQINRSKFSPAGQKWVSATEQCLQEALIPALTCDTTCALIEAVGLDSIPRCYVGNGYCSLEAMDYVQVLTTVGSGKYRDSLKRAIRYEHDCAQKVLSTINAAIQDKLSAAAAGGDQEQNLADTKALAIARVFHKSTTTDGPLEDISKALEYVQEIYDTAVLYQKDKLITIRTPSQLVLEWMRHLKYDDATFIALIGFIDQEFIWFAYNHGLPFYDSYPDPSFPDVAVEFDHLAATMDAVYRNGDGVNGDIGGWLGDLFTFYSDWQTESPKTPGHGFCVDKLAKPGDTSSFKLQDAIEDADGCNMAMDMRNTYGRTIVEEFHILLEGDLHSTRFKTLMNSQFKGTKAGAAEVACEYLREPFTSSPTVSVARRVLTRRRGQVKLPTDLSQEELQSFCDGFGEVMGDLAGIT